MLKNYWLGVTFFLALISPQANSSEIPDDTLLTKLPASAKLVVTGDLGCHYKCMCASDGSGILIGDNNGGNDPWLYTCDNFSLTRLRPGTPLPIHAIKKAAPGSDEFIISSETPDGVSVEFYLWRYPSTQVGALKRLLYGKFSMSYDDPYAGLTPEVVTDIVMGKIVSKLEKDDYSSALDDFRYLEKLQSDTELPESFYYYYVMALQKSGDKVNAQARAGAYLIKYGKRGKYYNKVVNIMSEL